MNKKNFIVPVIMVFVTLNLLAASFAADQKTQATKAPGAVTPSHTPTRTMPPKPNFGMIAGTITSIDSTDPANIKVSVKNDADGTVRTISVTPWTNITKITDISELKAGEPVRMMTRKMDDKDIAMGIMFGKLKTMPAPRPAAAAPKAPQPAQMPAGNVKK